MKCADPKLCYTNGTTKILRHFSQSSELFKLRAQTVFNCGTCLFCRKKKAYELASRCVLHSSLHQQNCFLTLTYDETKEGYHNVFEYPDIQRFKKDIRHHANTVRYSHIRTRREKSRRVEKRFYRNIQLFNVHEYGARGKKHWHLVVFGYDLPDKEIYTKKNDIPLYTSQILRKLWPFGFSTVGSVSEASAMYQAQYMEKDFKNNFAGTNKKSHSKHSGIGKPYFLKHYKQLLMLGYVPINGRKMPLPRYFEKLAHKHWSHFNQQQNFFDHKERKRLYAPFKKEQPNEEISKLFEQYKKIKQTKIDELTKEWEAYIHETWLSKYLGSGIFRPFIGT